jgi:hypothetical protein
MNTAEAIQTLGALFDHQATEIHCVVGKLITGVVDDYLSVVSNVVATGADVTNPEQKAIGTLCELFPGGASFVTELHLKRGAPIKALVHLRNDKGEKYVCCVGCKSADAESKCDGCTTEAGEVATAFVDAEYVWEAQ